MSYDENRDISSLSYSKVKHCDTDVVVDACGNEKVVVRKDKAGWGIGAAIISFLIIAAIVWVVLYLLRPAWLLNTTVTPAQLDLAKLTWVSLLIALVIVIILGVFMAFSRNHY